MDAPSTGKAGFFLGLCLGAFKLAQAYPHVAVALGFLVLAGAVYIAVRVLNPQPKPRPTPQPVTPTPPAATATPGPLPIFYVYQAKTPAIWGNDATAIRVDGYPFILHYDPDKKRNRRRRDTVCTETRKRQLGVVPNVSSCDEYPFAATQEGGIVAGRPARTVLASQAEQQTQAGDLGTFVIRNHLVLGSPFEVLPVP